VREQPFYHLDRNYMEQPICYGDIRLYQLGRMHCTGTTHIRKHLHLNLFELTIVTDGIGAVGINDEIMPLGAGDIHLSFPGDFHEITTDCEQPLKFNFFAFHTSDAFLVEKLEKIMQTCYAYDRRIFKDDRIRRLVGDAIAETNAMTEYSDRLLAAIFLQIVLYLIADLTKNSAHSFDGAVGQADELCYRMMHYIDTHLYTMENLSEMAQVLSYNYSYLSDLFHRLTGSTLNEYYRSRRLAAARLLLLEDKLKVGEIASLLRYSSIYTFSRSFREQYGVPPAVFARAHRNDDDK